MGKRYADYIRQEPEVVQRILEQRKSLSAGFIELAADRPIKRVYLLGSGSSWHCGLICRSLIREILGAEVVCLTSTMAAGQGFSSEDLYLAVSQSGTSNSTLGLVNGIREKGGRVAALTAERQSPIAAAADLVVPVLCGEEEIGPKSKGVTGTVVTLAVLFLELGLRLGKVSEPFYESCLREWKSAGRALAQAIQTGERFFEQNRAELVKAADFMLVAGPGQIGAARECALKLLETCWTPAYAYEFEEYMHGIHYTLGPGRHIFYLFPQREDAQRMEALYRFGIEQGAVSWALKPGGPQGWETAIPEDGGEVAEALSYLAFFQTLSCLCSEGRGIDCDVPRYPDFHARMKTKTIK